MRDQQTLSFGVLLLPEIQVLDAAGPVEYINGHSQEFLKLNEAIPESLIAKAASIKWHYISHSLEPVKTTSFPPMHPTTTLKACPKLDYLIVPGADPTRPLPEGCAAWLKDVLEKDLKGLLLICTGSLAVAGSSDMLNGVKVATNKLALKMLASTNHYENIKKVKWVGDRRWVIDGNIWSSAGVTAGIDLAVEFSKRTFDPEIVELTKNASEYIGKPDAPDEFAFVLEGVAL